MRHSGAFYLAMVLGLSLAACGSDDSVSGADEKTADNQGITIDTPDDNESSSSFAPVAKSSGSKTPAGNDSAISSESKTPASSATPTSNSDKSSNSDATKSSDSAKSSNSVTPASSATPESSASPTSSEAEVELPTFTDARDGNTYKYVTIGTQTWMAENLRYKPMASTEDYPRGSSSNVKKYGYFYTFKETVEQDLPKHPFQGACPSGWYVPTAMDFTILQNYIGGKEAGYKLKSKTDWDDDSNTDEYNFNALNTSSLTTNPHTAFLTASYAGNTSGARYAWLESNQKFTLMQSSRDMLASIRCIKESVADTAKYEVLSSSSAKSSSSVKSSSSAKSSSSIKYSSSEASSSSVALNKKFDVGPLQWLEDTRDGKRYQYVYIEKIKKSWMVENLNYLDALGHLKDGVNTWCYDNDPENCEKYGRLYTWGAAMDSVLCVGNAYNEEKECGYGKTCFCSVSKHHPIDTEIDEPWEGICPKGWYLPSYDDWKELFWAISDDEQQSLVFTNVAYYLKSTTDWESYYQNGVDYYKFNVLPAGYADANPDNSNVTFSDMHKSAKFWTSTESLAYNAYLASFRQGGQPDLNYTPKYLGFSVRCIR